MALMAMYWNRNYFVDLLDKMISYCGREEKILACNQMILLSFVEFAAVARLWSIFHLAIIMPMRWLAGKTNKLAHRKWGYISMGKVMENLKEDLQSIVNTPEIIHYLVFMMGVLPVLLELRQLLLPNHQYPHHEVLMMN